MSAIIKTSFLRKSFLSTPFLSTLGAIALWMPMLVQANAAIAGDKIYKIELEGTNATSQILEGESYKKIRGRSEWAVLIVNEVGTIQLKHTIRTTQAYGVSTWSNNVVTALNVCPISNQSRGCTNLTGDRFTMPKGNSIKDFRFELQTVEDDRPQVRFVQVPRNFIAEESPDVDNSRSRSVRK